MEIEVFENPAIATLLVPLVISLVQAAKLKLSLDGVKAFALSIGLGIAGAFAIVLKDQFDVIQTIWEGLFIGLSASGFYSGFKSAKKTDQEIYDELDKSPEFDQ